jgi:competence CoiA-like predicted nuclease
MVARVDNIVEGIINNYKVKVEVLIEVYFKVITRRSTIFIRNRITS